jgi:hypothetical protein
VALEACLAWGREGVRGIVADSTASSRRPVGLCLERQSGLVPLGPRTGAIRQELETGGRQPPTWPLVVEKPGRTRDAAPRVWHGPSLLRPVEVEYSDGRVALEALRFVIVHARPLAQQQTSTYAVAQEQEAPAVADHRQRGQARWFGWRPAAEAALAEEEGRGQGRRGRRTRPWRYPAVGYHVVADTRRTRRARRGRPAHTDPPATEGGYRVVVEVEALANPEEDHGWTVLAPTVSPAVRTDAEMLQAYPEPHTTVEPGFRWSKHPAAMAPGWREQPERIAALAMRTVVGVLGYSIIQRQVRLSLRTHEQQLPGNTGMTAIPTAAVVLALCRPVALVQLWIDEHEVVQSAGVQPQHLRICDALGLDHAWYKAPSAHQIDQFSQSP